MKTIKKIVSLSLILVLALLCVCGAGSETGKPEKNGDVYILFTSDIHCGIDKGFGFVGLEQVRQTLEDQGYTTILVDDGDAIQGEPIGTLTKGEAMIDLMNSMHYDVAIPGNHEFDYGMDNFLSLAEKAEFPYISCNFNKEGELVFAPYVIKEAAGMKIAFVGVTTPHTITSSVPTNFQNEKGEFIYGFLQDNTGKQVYAAVQKAVDDARAEGADYVYVMGHLGYAANSSPWSYESVISNTSGIDVFLDGHSHDTEQVVMKDKKGNEVVRSACGTKMSCIGYSHISAEGGIVETDIWSWPNGTSAPELLNIQNDIRGEIGTITDSLKETMDEVIATSEADLTINDPVEKDTKGNPIRMIRRAETNLGDFLADAFRISTEADIALINGGGIRANLKKGKVTYGDIINVFPFGNEACVVEATGQQILDALEWGVRKLPDESGGFFQVSGLSYEVDVSIPSGCKAGDDGMMIEIKGERRIKNVMVGEEKLDPKKTYSVAGNDYVLLSNGDGTTAFDEAKVLKEGIKLDNQLLIDYIIETLDGKIGEEYADPYGQERIIITDE